jgi:hypothetical protein
MAESAVPVRKLRELASHVSHQNQFPKNFFQSPLRTLPVIIQSNIDQSARGPTTEGWKNCRLYDRFLGKLTYNRFGNLYHIIAIDFFKQDLVGKNLL